MQLADNAFRTSVSFKTEDVEVNTDEILKTIASVRLEGRQVMRSDILPLLGFPEAEVDDASGSIRYSFTVGK